MARTVVLSKWGNSLAIRIPQHFSQELELEAGQITRLWIKDNHIVIEVPKTTQQKDDEWLENLLASHRA